MVEATSEPGVLGMICLLAAPVLALGFELDGVAVIFGTIVIFGVCLAVGFLFGEK